MECELLKSRAQLLRLLDECNDKFRCADYLRSLIVTSPLLHDDACSTGEFETIANTNFCTEYATIVDDLDGVNDYAQSILDFTRSCKNVSRSWKSSLSGELMCDLLPDCSKSSQYGADTVFNNVSLAHSLNTKHQPASSTQPGVWRGHIGRVCADYGVVSITSSDHTGAATTTASQQKFTRPNVTTSCSVTPRHRATVSAPVPPGHCSDESTRHCSLTSRRSHKTSARTAYSKRARDCDSDSELTDSQQTSDVKSVSVFTSAKQQLVMDRLKKRGYTSRQAADMVTRECSASSVENSASNTSDLTPAVRKAFVPPLRRSASIKSSGCVGGTGGGGGVLAKSSGGISEKSVINEQAEDERLKNIEPRMIELIMSEVLDQGPDITWDDIAGLDFAKNTIKEIVIWPLLRPDIFTGLRGPPKGLLLFGPPGTGKTLIGKCIASQSKSTFFSISASSLTSKWVGEGEKMVRALFTIARCRQPAVVFIDEIDSLLSQRCHSEHESSRRIKTEFLVQLDGAGTGAEDRVLVVGATNRPHELDEAARRRLVKRLYVPLPDTSARLHICRRLLKLQRHELSEQQLQDVAEKCRGFSGADVASLCREAALGPIRSIRADDIHHIAAEQVRAVTHDDFARALSGMRASVSTADLAVYEEWNSRYGTTVCQQP